MDGFQRVLSNYFSTKNIRSCLVMSVSIVCTSGLEIFVSLRPFVGTKLEAWFVATRAKGEAAVANGFGTRKSGLSLLEKSFYTYVFAKLPSWRTEDSVSKSINIQFLMILYT